MGNFVLINCTSNQKVANTVPNASPNENIPANKSLKIQKFSGKSGFFFCKLTWKSNKKSERWYRINTERVENLTIQTCGNCGNRAGIPATLPLEIFPHKKFH